MFALFIVLNEIEYLDDILTAFVDMGIKGATILDSQGMASALVKHHHGNIPIIGTLRGIIDSSRPYNKTIFTLVENEKIADEAMEMVNEIVGDMRTEGTGLMFTVPIGKVYGLRSSDQQENII